MKFLVLAAFVCVASAASNYDYRGSSGSWNRRPWDTPKANPTRYQNQPVAKASASVVTVRPTEKYVEPVVQPREPVYKAKIQPAQPLYRPAQPTFQTGYRPKVQPARSNFQPAQPTFQPAQPTFQAAQPTYQAKVYTTVQPVQPTYQPKAVVSVQPAQPTFQPAQPAFQPAEPSYNLPVSKTSITSYANDEEAEVLSNNLKMNENGYTSGYATGNGISAQETGSLRTVDNAKVMVVEGQYEYPGADGQKVIVTYTADETGFHPRSDILPTPPPVPKSVIRLLEYLSLHAPPQDEATKY